MEFMIFYGVTHHVDAENGKVTMRIRRDPPFMAGLMTGVLGVFLMQLLLAAATALSAESDPFAHRLVSAVHQMVFDGTLVLILALFAVLATYGARICWFPLELTVQEMSASSLVSTPASVTQESNGVKVERKPPTMLNAIDRLAGYGSEEEEEEEEQEKEEQEEEENYKQSSKKEKTASAAKKKQLAPAKQLPRWTRAKSVKQA
jgi:hypothetical protein